MLAEAGFARGFKTPINSTAGYGPDLLDAVQLAQRFLKDVCIETTMKLQEYGVYMATTFVSKFEGMAMGPISIGWEPDSVLYGLDVPGQPRNSGHVNDPNMTAMLQEQRRMQDLGARKQRIFDIQRYAAEQHYYVYTSSGMITASWQPYVKNLGPNHSFDYGSRGAVAGAVGVGGHQIVSVPLRWCMAKRTTDEQSTGVAAPTAGRRPAAM